MDNDNDFFSPKGASVDTAVLSIRKLLTRQPYSVRNLRNLGTLKNSFMQQLGVLNALPGERLKRTKLKGEVTTTSSCEILVKDPIL